MGDQDARRERAEQVVVVAVPSARLVADLEPVTQPAEGPEHVLDPADVRPVDDLSGLVQRANREACAVDVEPDVEHDCLPVRVSWYVHHQVPR
jgi:hypothetical protein